MIAGGRVHETTGAWLTRVKNLRIDDKLCLQHWNGQYWYGGETVVVSSLPEATGLRDGFVEFWVYAETCPESTTHLCIRPDDEVTVAARTVAPSSPPRKKPRKGQMSLF